MSSSDSGPERICVECGDDLVCEGYAYCSDCLELLGHAADEHEVVR